MANNNLTFNVTMGIEVDEDTAELALLMVQYYLNRNSNKSIKPTYNSDGTRTLEFIDS